MARKCTEPRADGQPCEMPPLEGKDKCWAHDPENARGRAEARRKGGNNRQTPKSADGPHPEYRSTDAIQELLERTVADTLLQENSDKRSRTIATLAGVLMKALEVGEMQERLDAIEKMLNKKRAA